ncbi:MAG: NAD(P)-dependent dehydrogenase (short-subunit alcohol dehydrogenase family)/acyl carrier protein [Pseudohongiellaceae bacterium]|jgi:NAD(P)-dependent dehydrogenase (short-subunit alcohol dehydrogenase family)/acyl carrier protein
MSDMPVDPSLLTEALRASRDGLAALMQMQQQTAELHRQFLEGQERSAGVFQTLLQQQQSLVTGGVWPTLAPAAAPAPLSAPAGVALPPAPVPMALPPVAAAAPIAAPAPVAPAPVIQPMARPVALPAPVAAPAPVAQPVAAAPASVAAGLDKNAVADVVLSVVSDKTGYPVDMLELSMGMDSDLGIDSIKRVEILSAIQDLLPEAPVVKPEHLGELKTLGQLADFLVPAGASPAPVASPVAVAPSAAGVDHASAVEVLLDVVSDKTGYPVDMLELSMGMDSDLGIDSIKRVEILSAIQERLPTAPVVKPEHLGELKTLGQLADFLSADTASASPASSNGAASASSNGVAPGAASSGEVDHAQAAEVLLDVVSEKTGYPVDMLELSMGMDSDLGIDSIKRVEILSAIQERLPEAPVVKPEHLGELKTLGQLANFLCSAEGGLPGKSEASSATGGLQPATEEQSEALVPLDTYAIELVDLSTPRNGTNFLPAGGRLWVSATKDGLSTALAARWQTLGLVTEEVALDGTDVPPDDLVGLIVVAPEGPCDSELPMRVFDLVRRCGPTLRASAEGDGAALLLTVSRVDGRFGLGDVAGDPLSGSMSGLTKSAHHEWLDVTCRAFDVSPELTDSAAVAEDIVAHALCNGPVEVGLHGEGAVAPELLPTQPRDGGSSPFTSEDVVVISGGARGITAEVALALAAAGSPRLVLLGRSPLPAVEPKWLSGKDDEAAVKQAIVSRAKSPMKPKQVQQQWREISAAREVRRNLARIEEAGSEVQYRAADVRDGKAVSKILASVRKKWGAITGLVHGAGVLADRMIDDKTDDDVRAVVSTKVDGLSALLTALADDDLKALALFSSTTARFGRKGQSDYAMANEALEKLARAEARRRPSCRVVSFGWGPWDGGMVDAGLRRLFAEEGIAVIPPKLGADLLVNELAALDGPGELIVLGGGSLITPRLEADRAEQHDAPAGSVTTVTRELSVADHAFLSAHVLDGKAVLPVAVMIEWLGHAALHGNPGLRLVGLDALAVFKGVLIDGESRVTLSLRAQRAVKRGAGSFSVVVELLSDSGGAHPVVHASATAVLAAQLPERVAALPVPDLKPFGRTVAQAYGEFLFHGPLLQGIKTVDGCGDTGIVATSSSASVPAEWMKRPLRSRWIAEPLALDSAFQMLILWCLWKHDLGSLPTRFASYRQYRSAFPEDGVRIEVRVKQHDTQRVVADIDWLDTAGAVVARMVGYECVLASSLSEHFSRNTLAAKQVRP